jgi:hypothetical protein
MSFEKTFRTKFIESIIDYKSDVLNDFRQQSKPERKEYYLIQYLAKDDLQPNS